MKKQLYILLSFFFLSATAVAQSEVSPVNTGAANFLTIPSSARSLAMGGIGTAIEGNNDAIFQNAATVWGGVANTGGATYTYVPWMRDYQSGYALHALGGFYKIDKRNAILAGVRYMGYPTINMEGNAAATTNKITPKEMAIDLGYSYLLAKNISLSGTVRYIRSDMGTAGGGKVANAMALDLGAFYKGEIKELAGGRWSLGLQVANLGTKIKYLETKYDLPFTTKLGGSVYLPFSDKHQLTLGGELGYRFLPTDIQFFTASCGAEYTFMHHFRFRGGCHYGNQEKGDDSYITAGLGVNYSVVQVDFSWLFANDDVLKRNTFWVSVGVGF